MSKQALSGLKVVEFGNFISAPYRTKMMADMGAEVVKIEEPVKGVNREIDRLVEEKIIY